jgi:putative salt-induced outer membrane protein YdiY
MSFLKRLIYIIFIISIPVSYAVEPVKPLKTLKLPRPLEPLNTELELGVFAASGNTNSKAAKGKVLIKQDFREWKNEYLLDMFYTQNVYDGETEVTAQKLFFSTQSDYKLSSENTSVFVFGSYTDDRLSGYDYQSTIAIGYSARLFSNETSFLNYSVGPGYSFTRANDGERISSNIFRIEGKYRYNLSFNSKFTQTLSTEIALNRGQNTESKSESAISAMLRQNLSMKAAYSVIHNSDPLDSNEKTDTVTSLTLAYSF